MSNLQELEVEDYLAECVQIDSLQLQDEYTRLPADIAYWNERYAKALRAHLRSKIEGDRVEARLQIEMREILLAEGVKVTEALVKARVDLHPEQLASREKMVEAEAEKARIMGVLDAVRTKRDMIISLGAHARIEMQGDPVLREQMRVKKLQAQSDGF